MSRSMHGTSTVRKHITQRFTETEVAEATEIMREKIARSKPKMRGCVRNSSKSLQRTYVNSGRDNYRRSSPRTMLRP